MKTVVQPLPQAGIESEKRSDCVAFRRAILISTRSCQKCSKQICLWGLAQIIDIVFMIQVAWAI